MKTKHTRGPWELQTQGKDHRILVQRGPEILDWDDAQSLSRADARLIAAAPELAAALEGLLRCSRLADMAHYSDDEMREAEQRGFAPEIIEEAKAVLAARAALEKAGRGVEGGGE